MKIYLRKISLYCLLFVVGLLSCNDNNDPIEEGIGSLEFEFNIVNESSNKFAINEEDLSSAIITIESETGEIVCDSEVVKFYNFDNSYITEPISLLSGTYKLTGFLILNSTDDVVYAAPLESSNNAYLVNNPLPIEFVISKDDVKKVTPEVLTTYESSPDDFGYSTFGFENVEIFDFLVTVFKYNEAISNFELTEAEILVKSSETTLYNGTVGAITNKITVNDNYPNYELTIEKEGYYSYNGVFTSDSLKKHLANPLTIILEQVDMVAYYPFNGNAVDESDNNNDGIVYGATLTNDRNGIANSAYHFDGDDYIEIVDFGNVIPTKEITISMWINSEQSKAQSQLMLCPNTDRFGISINYYHDSQNTNFFDYGWLGEGGNPPGRIYFRPEPFDTDWHHYVCISSISQSTMDIYKDGVLQISESDPRELLNAAGKELKIGSNDGFGFHNGDIDDIRIYNYALSLEEILDLYNE
ncbi:MAG: LamG domain-containing protein [Bacteroidales bacterium]|jgi:hypothetical protein|nr:LamG domain-containing protein [Bacteroidales bacterium]